MEQRKIIQKLANQVGISYAKAISVLRQMSKMPQLQDRLKDITNDKR